MVNEESKILLAGSTWDKDHKVLARSSEDSLIHDGWKLIVVPHEVDTEAILQCKSEFFGKGVLWSEVGWSFSILQYLIVDSIGVLSKLYNVADVAYVGGGFEASGVHNVLGANGLQSSCFLPAQYLSIDRSSRSEGLNHLQTINATVDLSAGNKIPERV